MDSLQWELSPQGAVLLTLLVMLLVLILVKNDVLRRRTKLQVHFGNDQTIGSMECQNDYFSTVWSDYGVCGVLADGISDRKEGRSASVLAVQTVTNKFLDLSPSDDMRAFLRSGFFHAHREIARKLGDRGGTSIASVYIKDGKLDWASVGNVRIYLYQKKELKMLNKTQIYQHLLENQALTAKIPRDVALRSKWKQEVTNYLGFENFRDVEISSKLVYVDNRDQVLICSAGVYNNLTILEMEKILAEKKPSQYKAEEMISKINAKRLKVQDNGSVLIIEVS